MSKSIIIETQGDNGLLMFPVHVYDYYQKQIGLDLDIVVEDKTIKASKIPLARNFFVQCSRDSGKNQKVEELCQITTQ